jgi:Protein of unknown function (DUF3616)
MATGVAAPAWPDDNDVWPVTQRLFGKNGKKSEDVSGIACTTTGGFPRACLVIDDELQAAQFVTVNDGELVAGEPVPLINNHHDGDPLALDGEAVASADGVFYVIGSHGHPRDKKKKLDPDVDSAKIKAKIAASSQVVRIRLRPASGQPLTPNDIQDVQSSSQLRDVIAAEPLLNRYMDRRLENNGLTIEGLAVAGNRLFAGFRAPGLDNGRAPILAVALDALFDGGGHQPRLHLLPLGEGRGVRDLAVFDGGILVLAGPAADGAGRYVIYWWDARSDNVRYLADVTEALGADKDQKPEAILPLDQGPSGLRVLILSDGAKEGAPRAVVIPAP